MWCVCAHLCLCVTCAYAFLCVCVGCVLVCMCCMCGLVYVRVWCVCALVCVVCVCHTCAGWCVCLSGGRRTNPQHCCLSLMNISVSVSLCIVVASGRALRGPPAEPQSRPERGAESIQPGGRRSIHNRAHPSSTSSSTWRKGRTVVVEGVFAVGSGC